MGSCPQRGGLWGTDQPGWDSQRACLGLTPLHPSFKGRWGVRPPKRLAGGGGQVPVADNTLPAGPHSLCTLEGC